MSGHARTPTAEPYDEPLTSEQQASIGVRLAACRAHYQGVSLERAIAEVRFAYAQTRGRAS